MNVFINRILTLFAIMLFSSLSLAANDGKMKLETGTMLLEGSIEVPFEYTYNRQFLLNLSFDPSFGYFVLPNFLVSGGIATSYRVFDSDTALSQPQAFHWGVNAGIRYYFDLGTNLFPYTGVALSIFLNDFALVSLKWAFDIPVGILWALNEHVGLSFGIPIRIAFGTTTFFERIVVTPGYLGIVAFF